MDWCRLSSRYYLDPAVSRAGEAAELLFVRCLAYAASADTSGDIPRTVLPMLAPTGADERVAALVREGLLLDEGDSLHIRSWVVWQESLERETARRRKDRDRKRAARASVQRNGAGLSADTGADSLRTGAGCPPRKEVEEDKNSLLTERVSTEPPRTDVEGLCRYFLAAVTANGVKASVTKKWRNEARLMLDRDQRDPHEIRAVIDWCAADPFWSANIHSVPTLRAKYDRLRLQMRGRRTVGDGIASRPDEDYLDPGVFGGGA